MPRLLPPPHPRIVPATDLGGVEVLKHGNLYLLADAFGDIHPDSRGLGLYDLDTRVLSCAVLRIDGRRPTLLRGQGAATHTGVIRLANPEPRREPSLEGDGGLRRQPKSYAITRRRWISDRLSERIDVTNFDGEPTTVDLELELDMDAADIFEVRGRHRDERGRMAPVEVDERSLTFRYTGLDGLTRATTVRFDPDEVADVVEAEATDDHPLEGAVAVRWRLDVPAGGVRSVGWSVTTELDGRPRDATAELGEEAEAIPPDPPGPEAADAEYGSWASACARIDSDGELLDLAIARSVADLRLLRNDGPRPGEHYLAAGVPWFTTLFGRDAIITALEVLPFMPDVARGALRSLADLQATEDDPERDAEPGKILHELRAGELMRTGEIPHRPYYGSVDSTPLWLVLLDETFRWTGDLDLVRELWPNALAALRWIDDWGDLDGDGLVEYRQRSSGGLRNQGWKDSSDSVRRRDGSICEPPIALIEVQGYCYDAKVRMAGLARRLGDHALALRLDADAARLYARVNERFWVDDLGTYAMALDGDKRPADVLASNAGHALWSGIVPPERVDGVVSALLGPALDSGWGIRTYGAGQPGFNPVGYHTGSIWPHDNAIVAAGMKRVGRHDAADRVARRIFEAAQHASGFRLPELFCGFDRTLSEVPVPYPVACSPQAWAAAAPLSLLQTMLGMRADAAEGRLELDHPHLPSWLGKVTVHELRVGQVEVDLLFHRWRGTTTSAEVLRRSAPLDVLIRV